MKGLLIGFIFTFIGLSGFSQDKKVDSVLNKWLVCYNAQNYEKAYDLYSAPYKQKVSLEWVTTQMKETFGMMGKLRSVKFISYKDYVYRYIFYAKAHQIEADVSVVITKDDQLGYLAFDRIGGSGDPPPAQKKQ